MLDTNITENISCAFAGQIVSYLYDEADAREKSKIETHLSSCAVCAEELAGLAAIRSSVIEWRNEEFSPLALPAIEIPYAKPPVLSKSETNSNVSDSLVNALRNLFSLSPALTASASFAVIAVLFGLIFLTAKSPNKIEVADTKSEKAEQILSAPQISNENSPALALNENSPIETNQTQPAEQTVNSDISVKKADQKENSGLPAAQKNPIVKISETTKKPAKINKVEPNPIKIKADNIENKKSVFAGTGKIPRLNNVEEEEDKSLRLAELFDEDDAK